MDYCDIFLFVLAGCARPTVHKAWHGSNNGKDNINFLTMKIKPI